MAIDKDRLGDTIKAADSAINQAHGQFSAVLRENKAFQMSKGEPLSTSTAQDLSKALKEAIRLNSETGKHLKAAIDEVEKA